jgi:magnesium chelatase accessory protein
MIFDTEQLDWEREASTWPHHETSRFVMADRVRFHVQVAGRGPVCLLLHGTGASTHSWRNVMPLLKQHFTVVMPDLPGHGFTSMPALEHVSLGGFAGLIASLACVNWTCRRNWLLAILPVRPSGLKWPCALRLSHEAL